MNNIDFEEFYFKIHTPLKSIEFLSDTIYDKYQEDSNIVIANSGQAEELLCLTNAIQLCAKYTLSCCQQMLNSIYEEK